MNDPMDEIYGEFEIPGDIDRPSTGNKYRVIVHLFYYGSGSVPKHVVKNIVLFDVEYADVPATIKKIYDMYFTSYPWHEIKSVASIKDEIYVNGELI